MNVGVIHFLEHTWIVRELHPYISMKTLSMEPNPTGSLGNVLELLYRYSGFWVRSVGPVGDLLEYQLNCTTTAYAISMDYSGSGNRW